jgi:signal transduction histidine kinase
MALDLERVAEEQAALRRIATLVAAGATEADLAAAVSSEVGALFDAQSASVVRWDGDTIRVIGSWAIDSVDVRPAGAVLTYGGDTLAARVVQTAAPARIDSVDELKTAFGRQRWAELGWQASIGAPVMVDRKVWGIVAASRTEPEPFPHGDEERLRDFSALIAQAIVNAEARRETAALVAEQSSLRHIATLVAAGRPQAEILDAVTAAAGTLFDATTVTLVHWEGVLNEVVVQAAWGTGVGEGSLYHPDRSGPTLHVLERGTACRGHEASPERGTQSVIAAPVITAAELYGALTAARPPDDPFPSGAEIRLRSFADLTAQSIANERAQTELRGSRARIVRTTDETRRRLERNLHDGAQQRLVSISLALRLAEQMLESADPSAARAVLRNASGELAEALQELRELARGLHPALLSEHGLEPALAAVTARTPFPVEITGIPERRLPGAIEAAVYYVVAESLTNTAKHGEASSATVTLSCDEDTLTVEIADNGRGGARLEAGSGLRGLVDRVEALGGELVLSSPHGAGTLVRAELPLEEPPESAPAPPPTLAGGPSTMSAEVSWEPVSILVTATEGAGEEMLALLTDEYGATGERSGDWWTLTIRPIDQFRRGTIIYRVVQASFTLAERHPSATIFLVTEDGNRWELPPPALQPGWSGAA